RGDVVALPGGLVTERDQRIRRGFKRLPRIAGQQIGRNTLSRRNLGTGRSDSRCGKRPLSRLRALLRLLQLRLRRLLKLRQSRRLSLQLVVIGELRALSVDPLLNDPVKLLLRLGSLETRAHVVVAPVALLDLLSRVSGVISAIGHADYTPSRLGPVRAFNGPPTDGGRNRFARDAKVLGGHLCALA